MREPFLVEGINLKAKTSENDCKADEKTQGITGQSHPKNTSQKIGSRCSGQHRNEQNEQAHQGEKSIPKVLLHLGKVISNSSKSNTPDSDKTFGSIGWSNPGLIPAHLIDFLSSKHPRPIGIEESDRVTPPRFLASLVPDHPTGRTTPVN